MQVKEIVSFPQKTPFDAHATCMQNIYRETSNIRRTKLSKVYVSRLVLQLYLPNPLKPSVKSSMKM